MILEQAFLLATLLLAQTKAEVEYINNANDLVNFANKVTSSGLTYMGTTVYLTCDLDMKGAIFNTIGALQLKYFSGEFDGNGYLIQNINFVAASDIQHTGLFGYVINGKVSNVVLDSSNSFENTYTGRLNLNYAGCATGSIVARCYDCAIENVASLATVINSGEYSASTGGSRRMGGVVGHSYGTTPSIKNAAYAGKMIFTGSGTSGVNVGGLVGFLDSTKLVNSFFLGVIKNSGSTTGSFVTAYIATQDSGTSTNTVENCYYKISDEDTKYIDFDIRVTSTNESLLSVLNRYSDENGLSKWGYVSHETNGGSNVGTRMSFFTYINSTLISPRKVGNTFNGWYTDDGLTNPWANRDTVKIFGSNIFVYAKWDINSYKLSFDSRGGSLVENRTVNYDEPLSLPEPEKEGETFYDWYELKEDGEETLFRELKMPARDVTLVATWGTIVRYEIIFNTTGGTEIPSLKYAEGSTIDLKNITEPEKLGHVFSHWYLENESSETEFNLTVMPGSDLVLCAKWNLNTYELTFYGQENHTLEFGETIPNETAEKEGYKFAYWYEEDSSIPFSLTAMPARDIVLYPLFEPIFYTLVLDFDNGEAQYQDSFVCCKKYVLPIPSKDGYNFSHWYSEDTDPNTPFDSEVMPSKNVTLRAKWTALCYVFSFDSAGGSAVDNVTFCSGEAAPLPPNPPKKSGYAFDYWYEDDETVPFNFTVLPFRDVALLAKWTALCYVFSFDSAGGSAVDNVTFCSGEAAPLPPNPPKKSGYAFDYWYEDDETVPFNFTVLPFRDVALHAMWANTSIYLEITFSRVYTADEIILEIQKFSEDFTIMEFSSDQGSTIVIVKFSDEDASKEFVRSIKNNEFFRDARIIQTTWEDMSSFKSTLAPTLTHTLLYNYFFFLCLYISVSLFIQEH